MIRPSLARRWVESSMLCRSRAPTNITAFLWEFLRNDVLDARNPFLTTKTPFRQNQYGAAGGGPIIKNKTFFYAGWQGFKYRRASEGLYRVPTEANLRGDFSDDPRQIYNPFTTRPNPSGTGFIRDPFPGNIIPTNLLNQGMLTYARTMLPAPINTGVPNRNARDTTPFVQDQNEWTFKIDQTLGDKDQVWFRYTAFDLDQSQSASSRPVLQRLAKESARTGQRVGFGRSAQRRCCRLSTAGFMSATMTTLGSVNAPADFDKQVGFAETFSRNFQAEDSTLFPSYHCKQLLRRW